MGKNLSFKNIGFDGGFWKARYDLNRTVSLENVRRRFEETGRFDALRFNAKEEGKSVPHIFYDSDAAKWIEAVAYLIMRDRDGYADEEALIDGLVDTMDKNRLPNGYLNSHFIQGEPENIFRNRDDHELYCAGHLLEAAIAYAEATGKTRFLSLMEDYMDCIERAFVTEKTAEFETPGHEEIELALVKAYEYTGKEKYLSLAAHFLDRRGKKEEIIVWNAINQKQEQSEIPVRELTEAEGHAVRAVYLYTGMAETALNTGDGEMLSVAKRLFDNIVDKRMYITGGIGSAKIGEAFTVPYDLPNLEAYSESCAAIGLLFFALALQKSERNARYGAAIERVMYNNLLSSTSLDGKAFFYENPLEYHLASVDKETSIREEHRTKLPIRHRLEVFDCSCCPPNINRIFARLGDLFFTEYGDTLTVNQYGALSLDTERVSLKMETAYPLDAKINVTVKSCDYKEIWFRIPDYCEKPVCKGIAYRIENGYLVVEMAGEMCFDLDFCMKPRFVEANPLVRADCGRVALLYGPTVYCLEALDNPYPLNAVSVSLSAKVKKAEGEGYSLPELRLTGKRESDFAGLYRNARKATEKVPLRFRPYYTFANREECDMLIWVRKA